MKVRYQSEIRQSQTPRGQYDLEFYKQVMTIKYSNFYIETIIRTIFINFEENIRK